MASSFRDDKENAGPPCGAGAAVSTSTSKPTPLPTLHLGHVDKDRVQPSDCALDFGHLPLGQSRALPFAITGGATGGGCLTVERTPPNVQVTLGPRSGVVLWTPANPGTLRGAIELLVAHDRPAVEGVQQRVRILVQGQAGVGVGAGAGTAPMKVATAVPAAAPRQPLRPATAGTLLSKQNRPVPQLQASFKAKRLDAAVPAVSVSSSHGGAAWEIGLEEEPPTPAIKRWRPPLSLSTPGRSLAKPAAPSTAAKPKPKQGGSSSSNSSHHAAAAAHAPSPRQERVLLEWVNHTLLPPSPAQASPHPAQFLQLQDDEAKARVARAFASPEFVGLRQGIRREIARHRLQLREDRDLFADLSLRESFLELLLSYQLPWLQLGLEVVLGVEVHKARLAQGRDGQLVRLSTQGAIRALLVSHVLADPAIAARYGASSSSASTGGSLLLKSVHGRAREAMLTELRAHLLERFLCLVALLDRAKSLEVLPRRRPLFRTSAAVKSSAELLFEFAKSYMAGEGSLAKHLKGMGYSLSGHKQTFLEEFDFRAADLGRDLRDGVRLARLVDALEGKAEDEASLCAQLRVPAVSRLQKVHNIKLTLASLQRAGLGTSATPDDLIEGRRDKTAALLWALARHYEQEELLASLPGITRLQAIARGRLARRCFLRLRGLAIALQRLVRARRVLLRCRRFPVPVAVALQARWRGMCGRRRAKTLRDARAHATANAQEAAAVVIQAQARGWVARRRFTALRATALAAQRLLRGVRARREVCRLLLLHRAARRLQARWRGHRQCKAFATLRAAAVVAQSLARRRLAMQRRQQMVAAAGVLRKAVRRWLGQRQGRAQGAAVVLQAAWRGHRDRVRVSQWRAAAVRVQAHYRRRVAQRRLHRMQAAVRVLQALARGRLVRRELQRRQTAAGTLQRRWRAMQARRAFRAHVDAMVAVQAWARGLVARRRLRKALAAVRQLQRWWRGIRARQSLERTESAATRIQAAWRATQARALRATALRGVTQLQAVVRGRRARTTALERRQALLVLQRAGRGFVTRLRAQRVQAALAVQAVQAAWRAHAARVRFLRTRRASIVLQAAVRAHLQRARFGRQRAAAVRLQAATRRWAAVRRYQRCLVGMRALQQRVRRRRLVRILQQHRAAVVRAQALWWGHCVRRQLACERVAAIRLQACMRGGMVRMRTRRFQRAVVCIQACLRGWRVRRVAGPQLRALRVRVAEAHARALADPSLRIGARHEAALEVLLTSKSCAHVLKCCKTLELSTGLARECCAALVEVQGVPKLLATIASLNRSEPHIVALRHILGVLGNVASHPSLRPALAEEAAGAVETLVELLQFYRPEDQTFLPAATLLLTAGRHGARAKADLRQPAVQRKLQSSLRLLERKADLELKSFKASARAGPKASGGGKQKQQEPSLAAPVRALRRLVELATQADDDEDKGMMGGPK